MRGTVVAGPDDEPPVVRKLPRPAVSTPRLSTNQQFIESLYSSLDIHDIPAVFAWVHASLPPRVRVYPTENYYYFSFFARGRSFWGNIRLGVEDRESKSVNFVYWEYLDDPQDPREGRVWARRFGRADGVAVSRISGTEYAVTFRKRRVRFRLSVPSTRPPRVVRLDPDEIFLGRTFDESGYQFFLLFRESQDHFMWVLNEEEGGVPGVLEPLADDLLYDRLSGFAFYTDAARNRKILVGVRAQNIRRNNYWDGPFDQLPDNALHPRLAECMERAYPYARGRIDAYGKFTDLEGSRVAITPYCEYESLEELEKGVAACRKYTQAEFLACISYDPKSALPGGRRRQRGSGAKRMPAGNGSGSRRVYRGTGAGSTPIATRFSRRS